MMSQPREEAAGSESIALSVTTVGAMLASVHGSALIMGLASIMSTTPYAWIATAMVVIGGDCGLFNSPNTDAIMSAVPPERRGVATGARTMFANTGQTLSIAIVCPLAIGRIPQKIMFRIFLYGGEMKGMPRD
ncbi:MAG: hypothetical protein M0T84_04900 [Betaproteobacteria bacterium]|nr:hypothetical protein [Betaproteobacteria bacterium]